VKAKDVAKYGSYRTQEMILDRYRAMASAPPLSTTHVAAVKALP